jgi:carboxylesterase type B
MLLLLLLLSCSLGAELRVETVYGPVVGGLRTTTTGTTPYVSFQGLPYASPPVGDLRLRPPV